VQGRSAAVYTKVEYTAKQLRLLEQNTQNPSPSALPATRIPDPHAGTPLLPFL
jgi:hypothetical protein